MIWYISGARAHILIACRVLLEKLASYPYLYLPDSKYCCTIFTSAKQCTHSSQRNYRYYYNRVASIRDCIRTTQPARSPPPTSPTHLFGRSRSTTLENELMYSSSRKTLPKPGRKSQSSYRVKHTAQSDSSTYYLVALNCETFQFSSAVRTSTPRWFKWLTSNSTWV